jgi:hypothetical protein
MSASIQGDFDGRCKRPFTGGGKCLMRTCLEEKCRLTQNCRLSRPGHCWLVCCDGWHPAIAGRRPKGNESEMFLLSKSEHSLHLDQGIDLLDGLSVLTSRAGFMAKTPFRSPSLQPPISRPGTRTCRKSLSGRLTRIWRNACGIRAWSRSMAGAKQFAMHPESAESLALIRRSSPTCSRPWAMPPTATPVPAETGLSSGRGRMESLHSLVTLEVPSLPSRIDGRVSASRFTSQTRQKRLARAL